MRILMIDNYDSFTYNLVQYLGELGADVTVKRNDVIEIAGVRALHPDAIVIRPAPARPKKRESRSRSSRSSPASCRFSACASASNAWVRHLEAASIARRA